MQTKGTGDRPTRLFVFAFELFLYRLRKYDICQSERFRGAKTTNMLSYHYV